MQTTNGSFNNTLEKKIPHIIHYFWFGGAPKPESVLACIASWRRFCPGFEIKEWNENNYDIHKHPFMKKAFDEKKWAFVSDYARLDILYQYGGIYLDTDVEILKDFSPLCSFEAFFGFENKEFVNDGQGFGCVKGMPVIKEMLEIYDGDEAYGFWAGEKQNIESPKLRTKVLLRHGLKCDGTRQSVSDVEVFPVDYFCPLDYATGRIRITDNTFSIHRYDGSWHGKNAQRYVKLMQGLNRAFGQRAGKVIFDFAIKIKDGLKIILGK